MPLAYSPLTINQDHYINGRLYGNGMEITNSIFLTTGIEVGQLVVLSHDDDGN